MVIPYLQPSNDDHSLNIESQGHTGRKIAEVVRMVVRLWFQPFGIDSRSR